MAESRSDARYEGPHPLAGALIALLLLGAALFGWLRRSHSQRPLVSEEALEEGHETSDTKSICRVVGVFIRAFCA